MKWLQISVVIVNDIIWSTQYFFLNAGKWTENILLVFSKILLQDINEFIFLNQNKNNNVEDIKRSNSFLSVTSPINIPLTFVSRQFVSLGTTVGTGNEGDVTQPQLRFDQDLTIYVQNYLRKYQDVALTQII